MAMRDILKRLFARKGKEQKAESKPQASAVQPRRKCIPGAFAKHRDRVAERACRRQGRELARLVAIPTRSGLKFALREHYIELLRRRRKTQA